MTWEDVKRAFPSQWVLMEALEAETIENKRIVEQMAVVESFNDDGESAFKKYIELHKIHKEREYFIYHTSRDILDIGVKRWLGIKFT